MFSSTGSTMKHATSRAEVVVWHNSGVFERAASQPAGRPHRTRGPGFPRRIDRWLGGDEHGIVAAVVATLERDHLRATRRAGRNREHEALRVDAVDVDDASTGAALLEALKARDAAAHL